MDEFCSEDRLPTLVFNLSDEETPAPSPEEVSSHTDTPPTVNSAPVRVEEPPLIDGYEILDRLGQGGMGVVYRARHVKLNRFVALKVLRHCDNDSDVQRFRREARLAARLQHANIVQVYEVGTYRDRDNGPERPYIAFEMVRGGGLNTLLRESVLPPREAAALLETLARTMQTVHDQGIVHRDLKPANVLLQEENLPQRRKDAKEERKEDRRGVGREEDNSPLFLGALPLRLCVFAGGSSFLPKITDFGLACLLEDFDSGLSRTGQLLGTPGYMAPEQIDGKRRQIGPAADIHALGAILYECLTGKPPFKGASLHETLALICGQEPVPVRRLRPDVPPDLETICHKCLHKNPARRYGSALELADDLMRFQQGRPIHARPVGHLEHAVRWCQRNPVLAALTAACLLLVVSLLGGGGWYASRLADARTAAATAEAEAAAAREVASAREHFALRQTTRQRAGQLELGWTRSGLTALERAATLTTRDIDRQELRGEAATCLTGIDLQPGKMISVGFCASRMAFHPRRPILAVGQAKGWVYCSVVLVDLRNHRKVQRLSLSSQRCWNGPRLVQDGITALAFSPDGRWLLAGTRTGWLHRWDLRQSSPRPQGWLAHKERVSDLLFGSGGEELISASSDRTVKRWSVRDGWKQTHLMAAHGSLTSGTAPGSLIVTDENKLHLVAVADLKPLRKPLPIHVSKARCWGHGPVLLANGNSLSLVDGESGRITQTLRNPGFEEAHESSISDISVCSDGMVLASASDQSRHVRLWETASGRLLANLAVLDGVAQIDFSPTGHTLAVLTGAEVHLHELGGFDVEHFAALHAWPVLACTFTRQGDIACLAGNRQTNQGELTFWSGSSDAPRWRRETTLPEARLPVRLHADANGQWLAYTEGAGLGVVPVARPRERLLAAPGEVQSLAFADAGLWLAVGQRVEKRTLPDLRVGMKWDNALGDMITGLGNVWAVAPGRRHVLVGGRDGCVRLLDARTGKLVNNWKICSSPIRSVALSADEELGLVGTWKGGVRLVRLPSGEKIGLPAKHRDRVESVVFLGSNLFASGSADCTLRLWSCNKRIVETWLTLSTRSAVQGLSASPNGERLAVMLHGERAVRILDINRLRARLTKLGLE